MSFKNNLKNADIDRLWEKIQQYKNIRLEDITVRDSDNSAFINESDLFEDFWCRIVY